MCPVRCIDELVDRRLVGRDAQDCEIQPGFESADTSVSAAVCLYPYTGPIETRGPNSLPLDYIGAHAPPFFIATGSHDALVVPSESRRFAETLRARSREAVVAAELPGAHHCFDLFHSIRCEHVVDAIDSFVTSVTERA